jgi:c-di-GMP-binding flagellar brake protein YcgR
MNIEGEEQAGSLSAYEPQTESLENRHEILNLLDRLIHHRAIITLRQPASNLEYPSAIFRIDESNNHLYLDEIAADKIEYPLTSGEEVQVRGQWNGGTVKFCETITELGEEDGYSFYLLPIPQQLQYRQRRKSYRVIVEQFVSISVVLHNEDGMVCAGRLHDISPSGASIWLPDCALEYRPLDVIENCTLVFPGNERLACDIEVRAIRFDKQQKRNMLGGRLLIRDQQSQQRIARLVRGVERRLIRKQRKHKEK